MSWQEFVKTHYDKVRHLPNNQRLKKLSELYKKTKPKTKSKKVKGGDLASDDARQDAYAKYLDSQGIKRDYLTDTEWKAQQIKRGNIQEGQTQAKGFTQLFNSPDKLKAPQIQYDKQETMKQVAKAEKKQAKVKNIWAPYKPPIILPIPDGYPYFLFQHPNKYSANPNQVMVCDSQARFLKSSIYSNLKKNLKYFPAKTSGYGASAPEAKIQPQKDFRIIFLFYRPDKDEYVYDAKDIDDYERVLDMCKDSGFIFPVEVLSKQVMDKNAQLAQAIAKQSKSTADYAWNAGAQATRDSWEQAVATAENQAEAQQEYYNTLAEQEAEAEKERNKKSGWDTALDVLGDVASVAVKLI